MKFKKSEPIDLKQLNRLDLFHVTNSNRDLNAVVLEPITENQQYLVVYDINNDGFLKVTDHDNTSCQLLSFVAFEELIYYTENIQPNILERYENIRNY